MNIESDFKPRGVNVSREESRFLKEKGLKWCPRCRTAKDLSIFVRKGAKRVMDYCGECRDTETILKAVFRTEKFKASVKLRLKLQGLSGFKPSGNRISIYEASILAELGCKWCPYCFKAVRFEQFRALKSERFSICKKCNPIRDAAYKAINNGKITKYNQSEERRASVKAYKNDPKNRVKRNLLKRNAYRTNPLIKFRLRLSEATRRLCNNKAGKDTLNIMGVNSVEHFISLMSVKTDNPNWFRDGYHLDHIWQFNWFSEFLLKNVENDHNLSLALPVIHGHKNLRPLSSTENCQRPKNDFLPLNLDDLPLYEPYLNSDIKQKIHCYFKSLSERPRSKNSK